MAKEGRVLINTGKGKGKTTAALGTTIRALGRGWKVAVLQFMKSQKTGEGGFLEAHAAVHPDKLRYRRFGLGFVRGAPSEADLAEARQALDQAKAYLADDFDLVVLDEICVALSLNMLDVAEVLESVRGRRPGMNVILTGRGCPQELIDLADTVTEMTEIKHGYQQGIKATPGIEF